MSLFKGVNESPAIFVASCAVLDDFVSIGTTTTLTRGIPISTLTDRSQPRIAASSYLNSAPLIWSFKYGSAKEAVELIEAVPAKCADLLAQGQAEVALIPAIEYQRIPDVVVVPNVCVGSREEVRSVLLVSRLSNLARVRRVALDESSRTSAALLKIIFREFLDFEPEWKDAKPDMQRMLAGNDAALMIGDPGMTFRREGLTVFDVARLWREFTNLGFVFAMWAISPNASFTARSIDFAGARDEGLERITEIIEYYQPLLGLPRVELQSYLQSNISFEPDAELRAGLDLFYKLAHKHQLVTALKPLQL